MEATTYTYYMGRIRLSCWCVSCDPGCTHWRIMINELKTWTVAAADGVRFARVRWEINFLLIFETAPSFFKHPVFCSTLISIFTLLKGGSSFEKVVWTPNCVMPLTTPKAHLSVCIHFVVTSFHIIASVFSGVEQTRKPFGRRSTSLVTEQSSLRRNEGMWRSERDTVATAPRYEHFVTGVVIPTDLCADGCRIWSVVVESCRKSL
jgi:hypothetical protein